MEYKVFRFGNICIIEWLTTSLSHVTFLVNHAFLPMKVQVSLGRSKLNLPPLIPSSFEVPYSSPKHSPSQVPHNGRLSKTRLKRKRYIQNRPGMGQLPGIRETL